MVDERHILGPGKDVPSEAQSSERVDPLAANKPDEVAAALFAATHEHHSHHQVGAGEAFLSGARSTLVAPLQALGEISDHLAGTQVSDSLAGLAGRPADTRFGSGAWAAEQLGSAAGMMPWMFAVTKGLSSGFRSVSGISELTAAQRIGISAASGLAYGTLLTPTGSGDHNWITHRLQNGFTSALTFGTLTGSTEGLAAQGIGNRAVAGFLSGVPAGFVDAQSRSLISRGRPASGTDVAQSIVTYSFLGGALGALPTFEQVRSPIRTGNGAAAEAMRVKTLAALAFDGMQPEVRLRNVPDPRGFENRTEASAKPKEAAGFVGYFLTDESAAHLRNGLVIDGQNVPLKWTAPDDLHITEQFGVKQSGGETWTQAEKASPKTIRAVGYALDNTGVESVVVSVDGKTQRADGKYYHITRSLADGRKAVESIATIDKAMAVDSARRQGRLAQIAPEDAQRFSYTALQPHEQFDLGANPGFKPSETAAKMEREHAPKPVVPFEQLTPKLQVISALKSTPADYLEQLIATRTPEHQAGSYFDLTPNQLKQELFKARWEPYNPLDERGNPIITGALGYRGTIAGGKLGMVPVESIPEPAALYLIDPKGTGKWSVSTVGVAEPQTNFVTMIVGQEPGQPHSVWTFHPGEPIRPSALDSSLLERVLGQQEISTQGLPDSGAGRRIAITRAQLAALNAQLPPDARMNLAKIESANNVQSP